MLQLAVHSASLLKPILFPLRFIGAFSILSLCGLSLVGSIRDVVAQTKRMHQIPCTKCRYFTGDYRLKCTANPLIANTEMAIGCGDYRETKNS